MTSLVNLAVDYYKEGTNNNECTQCPIGRATNSNTGSPSIDSCTARPGYEDNDNDNQYTLKPGYLDDTPSNNPDGIIDGCDNGYYNGIECISCGQDEGIKCTGGPIEGTNYPKRKLKSGNGLINNTYRCLGNQYRKW